MKAFFMPVLLAFSLGLNVVLIVGAVRLANQPPDRPQQHLRVIKPGGGGPGGPPLSMLLRFDEQRLKLTPEQQQAFKEIRERYEREEAKVRANATSQLEPLARTLASEDLTSATLKPFYKEARQYSGGFLTRLAKTIQAQRAVLTPEQNKIFTQLVNERVDKMQAIMQKRMAQDAEKRGPRREQPPTPPEEGPEKTPPPPAVTPH